MNILVACDSFKHCLSARAVAESVRAGIAAEDRDATIRLLPMADGGEGTIDALVASCNGSFVDASTFDPLGRPITARYGLIDRGTTAIIETAAASGIELLAPQERNPLDTSTFGTGVLVRDALGRGCTRIIIGLGGSATIDAGTGMAAALGAVFENRAGVPVRTCGRALIEIDRIDLSGLDERLARAAITGACDVTNPLAGDEGAACVYGPQKGADGETVACLDRALAKLAGVIRTDFGRDVEHLPGAGAAGGLGAGLVAFLDAKLERGFDIVRELTGLDGHVAWADIVITGEGSIDAQTRFGKTPAGVAKAAKEHGKPVIAIAGTIGPGIESLESDGFDAVLSIIDRPMTLDEAIGSAPVLVERCARSIMRMLRIGTRIGRD